MLPPLPVPVPPVPVLWPPPLPADAAGTRASAMANAATAVAAALGRAVISADQPFIVDLRSENETCFVRRCSIFARRIASPRAWGSITASHGRKSLGARPPDG